MDSHSVLLGPATRTIGETPGVMGKQLKPDRHEDEGSQGRVMV